MVFLAINWGEWLPGWDVRTAWDFRNYDHGSPWQDYSEAQLREWLQGRRDPFAHMQKTCQTQMLKWLVQVHWCCPLYSSCCGWGSRAKLVSIEFGFCDSFLVSLFPRHQYVKNSKKKECLLKRWGFGHPEAVLFFKDPGGTELTGKAGSLTPGLPMSKVFPHPLPTCSLYKSALEWIVLKNFSFK